MLTEPITGNSWAKVHLEFQDVVELLYRPLYQFAMSLTGSESEACDLTQQAFYTWGTKGAQLRDESKLRAWMFTTLHRLFLQTRRRETRFPHYELSQVGPELLGVSPPSECQLDSKLALEALAKLDEVFRAPVALYYLEDFPYKKIALILGVPIGTVKSRISRGIARLHKVLTDGPGELAGVR